MTGEDGPPDANEVIEGNGDHGDEALDSESDRAESNGDHEEAMLPEGLRLRGDVVGVERVSALEVPDSFPVAIWTDEALELTFEFARHDGRARTYFSLPDTDPDDRLANLLAHHRMDDPQDLEGRSVLLDVVDGHTVPVSVEESRRGDKRALYGVLAGVAPSITIALFSFFGLGEAVFSPVYIGLYLVCTFVVLPISIYIDAWHLRTTTDWEGSPLKWTLLAIVPPLYVVVVPYYLISRENARPLAFEPASAA